MIKVDLITGFLGSGKTTFLKQYAKHFIDKGEKVGILENDYGAVNVDMLLLNELRCDNCELEMVAGAGDADCHKRRFKTKLISMGMSGYNRVIIEPSGIFDIDEFFDSLREDPLERWYEIGSVITIVDSTLDTNLSDDSNYYLASQIANAGIIVFSKSQLATSDQIDNTISHIKAAASVAKIAKPIENLCFIKNWDELDSNDFENISSSGYSLSSFVKLKNAQDNDYSTLYYLESSLTTAKIKALYFELFNNNKYGTVHRIKGFFLEDGQWFQVNATKNSFTLEKMDVGQEVFIVIGENLVKSLIDEKMV